MRKLTVSHMGRIIQMHPVVLENFSNRVPEPLTPEQYAANMGQARMMVWLENLNKVDTNRDWKHCWRLYNQACNTFSVQPECTEEHFQDVMQPVNQ